jgi:hypothetical protein
MPLPTEYVGPAFAYETLPSDGTVKTLTSATYEAGLDGTRVRAAYISVETNAIRWRCDGGNPDASTTGHQTVANEDILLLGYQNVKNFKFTQVSAGGSLKITYYR